jgi:hypothetical protein
MTLFEDFALLFIVAAFGWAVFPLTLGAIESLLSRLDSGSGFYLAKEAAGIESTHFEFAMPHASMVVVCTTVAAIAGVTSGAGRLDRRHHTATETSSISTANWAREQSSDVFTAKSENLDGWFS